MFGRRSVRVTYAHKKRRAQNANKRLAESSPLEILEPDVDDLTRTEVTRRMLKRSRRVALSEQQLEDKNVEHIREHLAKRIKRVSNLEPTEEHLDTAPSGDTCYHTPRSSRSVHESTVDKSPASEQLSPVPVSKRVLSRTSSKNLKENSTRPRALASPFRSRPGSAAASPKHKGKSRSSRRIFLHANSRTLSGVFKEDSRQVSRKGSTVSLTNTRGESAARHTKHQRYPSSPSASYMRSQFVQEDWIPPPKALARAVDDAYDAIPSPIGSVRSNGSFYADQPQFCSTPSTSMLRGGFRNDKFISPCSPREDSGNDPDVEMLDDTVSARRKAIHLSGNSIFSSSGEFTLRSLATAHNDAMIVERNNVSDRDEELHLGQSLAGSFIAEYHVPLSGSPALSAVTKVLASEGVPKLSVGVQPFGLPGTSPARDENLFIRTSRRLGTLTPPASPHRVDVPCPPSSPASDLALGLQSMDIQAGDVHSDGEPHPLLASITLQTRAHSLQEAPVVPSTKKPVKRRSARTRAGTIRASDVAKLGAAAPGSIAAPPPNVRRTRSGTIVGPDSKLAVKSTGLSGKTTKGAPATRLAAVPSGSDAESDDELLLKGRWTEDVEYLGRPAPPGWQDAEADELNLGGPWHDFAPDPPLRRPGLRLRRR